MCFSPVWSFWSFFKTPISSSTEKINELPLCTICACCRVDIILTQWSSDNFHGQWFDLWMGVFYQSGVHVWLWIDCTVSSDLVNHRSDLRSHLTVFPASSQLCPAADMPTFDRVHFCNLCPGVFCFSPSTSHPQKKNTIVRGNIKQ